MRTFKALTIAACIWLLFGVVDTFGQKTTSEIVVKYNHDKGRAETEVKTKKVEQPDKNTNTSSTPVSGTAKSAEAVMNGVFSGRISRALFEQQQAEMARVRREKATQVATVAVKYPKELLALYHALKASGVANQNQNYDLIQKYATANGISNNDAGVMFEKNPYPNNERLPFTVLSNIEDRLLKEQMNLKDVERRMAAVIYENFAFRHKEELLKIHRLYGNTIAIRQQDVTKTSNYARAVGMDSKTIDSLTYTNSTKNGFLDFGKDFNDYLESAYAAEGLKKLVPIQGKLVQVNSQMVALKIGKQSFNNPRVDSLFRALGMKAEMDSVLTFLGKGNLQQMLRIALTEQKGNKIPLAEVLQATATEMYKRGINNSVAHAEQIKNVMFDLGFYYKDYLELFSCNADNGELQPQVGAVAKNVTTYKGPNGKVYSSYDCAEMRYTKLIPYYDEAKQDDLQMIDELDRTSRKDLKKLVKLILEKRVKNEIGNTRGLIALCAQNKFTEVGQYFTNFVSTWSNIEAYAEAIEMPYLFLSKYL